MNEQIKIETLLLTGDPDGLSITKISGWVGRAFVVSRANVAALFKRDELIGSGVYLLVGEDPDDPFKTAVYVGETDNLANRLRQHVRDEAKEFAQRLIAFTALDGSLSKTSVRALEARFVRWAQTQQNVSIKNSVFPSEVVLNEFERGDIEQYFQKAIICLRQIGITFVARSEPPEVVTTPAEIPDERVSVSPSEPVSDVHNPSDGSIPWFQFELGKALAWGKPQGSAFVVRAGSTALAVGTSKVKRDLAYRDYLVDEGILVLTDDSEVLRFKVDHVFSSASKAGGVVKNGNCSGKQAWRLPNSKLSLGDWESQQVEVA